MPKNPTKITTSYAEKLKDPRWIKKRVEILERDDWVCQNCGEDTTTLHVHQLHVHHTCYKAHINPWDYKKELLITLCETCHKKEHDKVNGHFKDVERAVQDAKETGYLISDIEYLVNTFIDKFNSRDDFLKFMTYASGYIHGRK